MSISESSIGLSDIRFIDLFCGIGGFRLAMEEAARRAGFGARCVLSSDIDENCRRAYRENFEELPRRDIREISDRNVPDCDFLLAGFPCQPFSIIGEGKGFADAVNGTLFFEILRILKSKRPRAFLLENVKRLVSHQQGRTLDIIVRSLNDLGYAVHHKVLNALDFGLPQKRERLFIFGYRGGKGGAFLWPEGGVRMKPLDAVLERDEEVPEKYFASEYIRQKRLAAHVPTHFPAIWHENKGGNVSSHPFSCALRAHASYNYLLVNGKRRLTPREMLRLQGFPDSYKIVCSGEQTRTQAGNSLPVPVAREILVEAFRRYFGKSEDGANGRSGSE